MLLTAKQAMINKIFFVETSKKGDMSQPMKSVGAQYTQFYYINEIVIINKLLTYRD
jgi:hypothetical protein